VHLSNGVASVQVSIALIRFRTIEISLGPPSRKETVVLINTVYRDELGMLHRRSDRGSNRQALTRHTEEDLPLHAQVLAVVIVNEEARELPDAEWETPSTITLRQSSSHSS
jgi:hypothetical protein